MPVDNIVTQQKINQQKIQLSKQFRQEMTDSEDILWQNLRRNQLDGWHFRRQQIIDGFLVDFYCHMAALVVEVDGDIHLQQIENDQERTLALEKRGIKVIRFSNQEVLHDLCGVLKRIKLGLTPSPPSLKGRGDLENQSPVNLDTTSSEPPLDHILTPISDLCPSPPSLQGRGPGG